MTFIDSKGGHFQVNWCFATKYCKQFQHQIVTCDYGKEDGSVSVNVFRDEGQGRGRVAVGVEDLKVLVHLHLPPQVFLQVLDPHFRHLAVQAVHGHGSKRRQEIPDIVRRVYVVVGAAVGRPQLVGDAHTVLVISTDGVARRGHPGDDVGPAKAEVVEADADPLYMLPPGPDVELPYHRDHVGEGVGGGAVFNGRLVLVGIQLTSFILHHIRVVVQHRLSVFKALVQVTGGEGHHVSIPGGFCQLKRQIKGLFFYFLYINGIF